jgi:hypothetical protein
MRRRVADLLPAYPWRSLGGYHAARGLRLGCDNAADRIHEAPLHVEAGKYGEDALHLVRRDPVVLGPAEVETDPSRAERDFRLLVQADRRGGIQSDAVPDQLHAAIVETLLARERPRCVGSFYLEALWDP